MPADRQDGHYVVDCTGPKSFRIIPAIAFADGSLLVEPSHAQLVAKPGLKTQASRHQLGWLLT
ncbi:MAG: hypothetical protein KF832_13550 [Caldilineaceae bacterium]|nr:hypothetical protein [Caldilineaceae bacterium]